MVECIRTVHLHSAAVLPKEVLWSTCGQMHPQSSSAPCSLSARVRTRHKLAGTGFSCTLQPSPREARAGLGATLHIVRNLYFQRGSLRLTGSLSVRAEGLLKVKVRDSVGARAY